MSEHDTPVSEQAASPDTPDDGPPSWHAPVKALDVRVTRLEGGLERLEAKTDAQTVMLGEIKGALGAAARNPWVRAFLVALALAFAGWLSRHGIKVEVPQ